MQIPGTIEPNLTLLELPIHMDVVHVLCGVEVDQALLLHH